MWDPFFLWVTGDNWWAMTTEEYSFKNPGMDEKHPGSTVVNIYVTCFHDPKTPHVLAAGVGVGF